jgi:hypothetical protein
MPSAKGKIPLNVSIDARVALAARRVFAGRKRGKQLSDFLQRALVRKCIESGERIPEDLLTKAAK